jgi:xanthine dehydrogenase YagS FAD-binding subunit
MAFEWVDAASLDDALAHVQAGGTIKAGGVDLGDRIKERLVAPARLVNLRTVPGLDRVDESREHGLRVGAMVTLAALAREGLIARRYRALADAASHAATPQIRNMATVGGNLLQRPRCWYFRNEAFPCRRKGGERCFALDGENAYHAVFDNQLCAIVHPSALATALTALGASVTLVGPRGRREVALADLYARPEDDVHREALVDPAEILTEVRVPAPAAGATSAYTKLGEKQSFDWPIAEAAVALVRQGGRCTSATIVLGAAAPTPHRARAAEAALVGKPVSEETARAAATAAISGATPLAENAYKLPLLETIVRRTILAAAEGGQP